MKPVSPVIKGFEQFEVQVGAGQKQYFPIPTLVTEHTASSIEEKRFVSRWEFTQHERELIAAGGSLIFEQLVFGNGLFNPITLSVMPKPEIDPNEQVSVWEMDEPCL